MVKIKVGMKVKLDHYTNYDDYIRHKGEVATISKYYNNTEVEIRWADGDTSIASTIKDTVYAQVIPLSTKTMKLRESILKGK